MMGLWAYWKKRKRQAGFTLIELVVAIAISAIIMAGASVLLWQLAVSSSGTTNQAVANLQVHYVSSWIGQDVIQAGNITLGGNATTGNFPLTIIIPTYNNATMETVIYDIEPMKDKLGNELWKLYRTEAHPGVTGNSTSLIAEYLDPQSTGLCAVGNSTRVDALRLKVGAIIDTKEAAAIYAINPRRDVTNVTWVVREDQVCRY
jgi:prepilin-type N-terminal cleavage/methylation domain-containing protein